MKMIADNKLLPQQLTAFLQWCVVLIGLSVPISVVSDNILLALILLGTLFSLKNIIVHLVSTHPVARAALLLFLILDVAMFYGATPLKDALVILVKYIDLAFIPIFIFLLSDPVVRRRARRAFLLAMAVTLVVSYLIGFEWVAVAPWMHSWTVPSNPAIFHSHITQNNMMAFATFLALLEWRDAATRISRSAWILFVLFAMYNMLFMVAGRTGYLILLALLGWFTWSSFSRMMHRQGRAWDWRLKTLVISMLMVGALASYSISAHLHNRVALAISEYQNWVPGRADTSIGQRMDFYFNTLQIVKAHALIGVGTGGFPAAFELQMNGLLKTTNPHNEYLMISVQTGLIGLALMLYLFYTHWRYAPMLESPFEQDAARGLLLAYAINCMLNSALMDHADGLFFAFLTAVFFANLKTGTKSD